MKNTLKYLTIAIILIVSSCTDPDCIDSGGEFIGVGFYDAQTGDVEQIRINFLQLEGSADTLAFEVEDAASVILPINPGAEQITAFFDTEFGLDTVVIGYNQVTSLISEECGTEILYKGITVVRNDFDSINVVNTSTELNFLDGTSVNENIRIFN